MEIGLELNGEPATFDAGESELLLDVLRRNGLTGVKRGCDTGACGACNVIIDGEVCQSCVTPASHIEDTTVETIEGLGAQDDLHPIQQAFVDHNATQCGYCIPGMIMSAKELLEENPEPSEQEVRESIEGNLCRCTGYEKPVKAIQSAAETMRTDVATDGGSEEVSADE